MNEILFASDESTKDIGVAGVLAAEPNQMSIEVLRSRIAALKQAIDDDDRAAIKAALVDAVPDLSRNSA